MALNTVTPKRLADAQYLSNSYGTLYTVPASTKAIVKELVLCNTDTAEHTVSVRVVPSGETAGDEHCIFKDAAIPANTTWHLGEMSLVLEADEDVNGVADAASKVTIRLSGVEVTS